jgi:hypothetical protein
MFGPCRIVTRLLGAQLVGAYGAEISKRADIVAAAIHAGSTATALLCELTDLARRITLLG